MFRMKNVLNPAEVLGLRILPTAAATEFNVNKTQQALTDDCVPVRRNRKRRFTASGASEPVRTTWF